MSSRRSVSTSVSADDGSSKTRIRAWRSSARAISTSWRRADREAAGPGPPGRCRSRTARGRRAPDRASRAAETMPRRDGSRPRNRFSATDRSGTSWSSWWMTATPASRASCGPAKATGSAVDARSRPRSVPAGQRPPMMLMSVDLPAPFSPTSARTSPPAQLEVHARRGRGRPENSLTMPRISRCTAGVGGVTAVVAVMVWSSGRRRPGTASRAPAMLSARSRRQVLVDVLLGHRRRIQLDALRNRRLGELAEAAAVGDQAGEVDCARRPSSGCTGRSRRRCRPP